ncbi:MAG: hypothetical protein ACI91R_000995 [Vicingaceae bacterium]|jgi:hypothetical protein
MKLLNVVFESKVLTVECLMKINKKKLGDVYFIDCIAC